MNDTELTSRVRESVANVHTATPAEQIISRGRAVRARRRINGAAGTLAAAGGITLVVAALLPSSHQPAAHLAAWTVAKQNNGDVYVPISFPRRTLCCGSARLQKSLPPTSSPNSSRTEPYTSTNLSNASLHAAQLC